MGGFLEWRRRANTLQQHKTFTLGETCCNFTNDANSKTHAKSKTHASTEMCCKAQRGKTKTKKNNHAANIDIMQSKKLSNSENNCKKLKTQRISTQRKSAKC